MSVVEPKNTIDENQKKEYTDTLSVLDKGYVKLIDTFGDELTIVNAARVSFGVQKTELSKGDIGLIRYLYRHKHYSPI